jgi:hypothetical protein
MVSTRWHRNVRRYLLLGALPSVSGLLSIGKQSVRILPTSTLSSLTSGETGTGVDLNNALDGVDDFEEWFLSNTSSGARVNNIRHAVFASMGRGLQFTSAKSSDLSRVAVVPRNIVMRVPYSDDEDVPNSRSWDTNLSCKLWNECRKGKDSIYYG